MPTEQQYGRPRVAVVSVRGVVGGDLAVSSYRCFTPGPVALARLVSPACRRWRAEDDFQGAKEICHLDKAQVTCWNSWHRWSVIALVTYAFLVVTV
ncbi:hypothetical protein ACIRPU_18790 [Streptomyces sp. NPDC102259]|uniref:hypothetical protein n=1 Tax=Streptomyces sp. NPDC102259 TaxID=3366148 RepID=UPI0038258370